MTTPARLPPGVSTQTITVPSTSRTAMYCVDARTPLNTRRVVFQVSVPDCMVYVCGLCIFGPGALDQYDTPLICFDVSGVTEDVNVVIPDQAEVVLGGCFPVSVVTLGPAGQDAPSCYDANTLQEALDLVESRSSANPEVPAFEILVYPGTYATPPAAVTDGPDLSIIGQGCDCEDVVFDFPAIQPGDQNIMLFFTRTTVCVKNVKFQALDNSGDPIVGLVEAFGSNWSNDKKATFENVCFEGIDNYNTTISRTFLLRLVALTKVVVESCKFDPGEGASIPAMVKVGLSVEDNVDVRADNCVIGFAAGDFSRFFGTASMEATVRGQNASPLREVSLRVNDCTLGRAGAECIVLKQGTRATVEATDCMFRNSAVPLTAFHVSFDLTGVPWNPRSLMIDNCEFLDNVRDVEIPSDTQGIQYSVTNCRFSNVYYPGPRDNPTPKYSIVSLQNENSVSENSLTIAAVHTGIGDSYKTNTVFLGSPSIVPSYVYSETAGGFGGNLVDTITASPYIDNSVFETVLEAQNDVLWVGFSEPMVGLFYNVQDGGVHPNLNAAVKIVSGTFGAIPFSSRFVYDVDPIISTSGFNPADSDSRVYGLPVGSYTTSLGITNGTSAYWVAMMRTTPDGVSGFNMNALRGVGCSYSYRNGRNVVIIGCDNPLIAFSVSALSPVSFAPATDPLPTPVFFGKQLQFSSPMNLVGSSPGVQGGTVSFGLPNNTDASKPITAVVEVGVTGTGNTTAALRMQLGCLEMLQMNNKIGLDSLGTDPPLFYDSGPVPVSPAPVDTTKKLMFQIPAGTFLSATKMQTVVPTMTLLVSRDASVDGDPADIHVLNTTICYSTFG